VPAVRPRRGRTLVALLALALAATGCASDEAPSPAPTPTASEPSSTLAPTDSDGITTTSDVYPEWQPINGLAVPRDDFGTAVVGDDIWALGGMTGERGNRLLSIEVLDTATGTWSTSDIEMPVGVASFETVAIGPRIYAFGGFDAASQAMDFAAVLDTRSGEWRDLPALPHARYAHTATLYDGKVYVIGGRDLDGEIDDVDVFDPRSETWETLDTPMPKRRARDSHKTVATPQGLVVAGGQSDFEDSALVDLFDPATGRWRALPDLPEPMSRSGLALADGKLWITLHESAYVMDAEAFDTWEEGNALTLSRHGMGFVVHDGYIYSIGGCALNPLRDVRTTDRLALG
jgi:hypothetical protein